MTYREKRFAFLWMAYRDMVEYLEQVTEALEKNKSYQLFICACEVQRKIAAHFKNAEPPAQYAEMIDQQSPDGWHPAGPHHCWTDEDTRRAGFSLNKWVLTTLRLNALGIAGSSQQPVDSSQ